MLRWLISTAGAGLLKSEVAERLRGVGRRAGVMVVVVLLWLAALGFAVATFMTWLSERLGTIEACGVVAATLAIVAIVIQVTLRLSRRRRPREKVRSPLGDLGLGEELASASPIGMVAVIAVLGYLLGRQAGRK
jgi:uncharacterized membrane protein